MFTTLEMLDQYQLVHMMVDRNNAPCFKYIIHYIHEKHVGRAAQ